MYSGMNGDGSAQQIEEVFMLINVYVIPIIVSVGLLGNTMCFVIFVSTSMRKLSTSIYLAALAVTDSGFLICLLIGNWLSNHKVHAHISYSLAGCRIMMYATYVFSFLSVWYVVSFTVERFIAVCFPLKRPELCTSKRAAIVVSGLGFVALGGYIVSIPTFGIFEVRTDSNSSVFVCSPVLEYMSWMNIINYVDAAFTLVIPSVGLVCLNASIAYIIIVSEKRRDRMLKEQLAARHSGLSTMKSDRARHHVQIKITKMLLLVSVTYLVLSIPSYIIRINYMVHYFTSNEQYLPSVAEKICQEIFQVLYYVNFSVNFFLYSMSGSNFRKELRILCKRPRAIKYFRNFSQRAAKMMSSVTSRQSVTTRMTIVDPDVNVETERMVENHELPDVHGMNGSAEQYVMLQK